jgi:hypothetical protein
MPAGIADGTPDISSTTSTPSRRSRCEDRLALLRRDGSCAPIVRASSRRVGFTSLAMMRDAPAALQMPTAKMPIGRSRYDNRRPDISSDERGVKARCPSDRGCRRSRRDGVVEMPDVRRRHRDEVGEASIAVDADDLRVGQTCALPVRQR